MSKRSSELRVPKYIRLYPASTRSVQNGHNPILRLQRTLGNQGVAQFIQAKRLTPDGRVLGLRPKLTIGLLTIATNRKLEHAVGRY